MTTTPVKPEVCRALDNAWASLLWACEHARTEHVARACREAMSAVEEISALAAHDEAAPA